MNKQFPENMFSIEKLEALTDATLQAYRTLFKATSAQNRNARRMWIRFQAFTEALAIIRSTSPTIESTLSAERLDKSNVPTP